MMIKLWFQLLSLSKFETNWNNIAKFWDWRLPEVVFKTELKQFCLYKNLAVTDSVSLKSSGFKYRKQFTPLLAAACGAAPTESKSAPRFFAAKLDRRFRTDPCHGYIFAYLIKWLSRNLVDSLFWFPGARAELPPATLRRAKIGSGYPKATFAVKSFEGYLYTLTENHRAIQITNSKAFIEFLAEEFGKKFLFTIKKDDDRDLYASLRWVHWSPILFK